MGKAAVVFVFGTVLVTTCVHKHCNIVHLCQIIKKCSDVTYGALLHWRCEFSLLTGILFRPRNIEEMGHVTFYHREHFFLLRVIVGVTIWLVNFVVVGKNSYLYIVAVACYKKQSWVIEGPRSETEVSRTFMSSIYKYGSRIPRLWSWWKKNISYKGCIRLVHYPMKK